MKSSSTPRANAQSEPLTAPTQRLWCSRGLNHLTAFAIAAELGDQRRLATACRVMSHVELILSDETRARAPSITKTSLSADAPTQTRCIPPELIGHSRPGSSRWPI
jgi:hypothetical protein